MDQVPLRSVFARPCRLRLSLLLAALVGCLLPWDAPQWVTRALGSGGLSGDPSGYVWIGAGMLALAVWSVRGVLRQGEMLDAGGVYRAWSISSAVEWTALILWGIGLALFHRCGWRSAGPGFWVSEASLGACVAVTVFVQPTHTLRILAGMGGITAPSDPIWRVFPRIAGWSLLTSIGLVGSYLLPWGTLFPSATVVRGFESLVGRGWMPHVEVAWGALYGGVLFYAGCAWTIQRGRWSPPGRLTHTGVLAAWARANVIQAIGLTMWGASLYRRWYAIMMFSGHAVSAGSLLACTVLLTSITPLLLFVALRVRGRREFEEHLTEGPKRNTTPPPRHEPGARA